MNDQAVADALLDAARAWIAERGMTAMRGPGEYSNATHEIQGVLVEGFEFPPTVDLTHNPPYYDELLDATGGWPSRWTTSPTRSGPPANQRSLRTLAEKVAERSHITTRPVDLSRFEEELTLLIHIYNDAWAENWGFLPVTDEEADDRRRDAPADRRPAAHPLRLRRTASQRRFSARIPDPNWALRPRWKWYGDSDAVRIARLLATRRHIPRVRLMFFGIRKQYRHLGVDAVLFTQMLEYAQTKHYLECEPSMLLEHNDLVIRASAYMGGHEYKRWRIYDAPV